MANGNAFGIADVVQVSNDSAMLALCLMPISYREQSRQTQCGIGFALEN